MSLELLNYLKENNIALVNVILSKRNSDICVGYHLLSPSIEKHQESIFLIREYLIKNGDKYSVTDGAETIKTKNDIFLHVN